ncbi:Glutamate synthase domain-containing protein 2 [Ruegeria intermedia]|uniref:Glutamate synthase domain-containing protein 2 n=1 Tax=Ruegeria intermedia TaxID=996115 RepID=A0A1M4VTN9_9RHOB|nr:FMN-binding glutamate synthase family protein [Ruegeria intermedia]SHE72481.1 Glutamate synthase domain-containing protein 2 [Ruegeria intermedia]
MIVRRIYFAVTFVALPLTVILGLFWPPALWLLVLLVPYALVGLYDMLTTRHNVLNNYPVLGHFRYMLEFVSPEIRQYFVETNESGRPFNRIVRSLVYSRAKGQVDTQAFGTQYDILKVGYHRANHSLAPKAVPDSEARILLGGPQCEKPYLASRLNVSAMSFGALSANAIRALNGGARDGGFAHNTGEGGLSPHHLAEGGDIIWQIGTGYFGCRTPEGGFDKDKFAERARMEVVKAIEIKLSQGAKPSHGGVLPAAKVDAEIAEIRGVPVHQDVISPPTHSAFDGPAGLLHFVRQLRELSGGKPVGFKLCIGARSEFLAICKAMLETGILPDFITVDGAEGGTGAAPVEFTNRLGAPLNEALIFVDNSLRGVGLRDKIRVIASGKVATGYDMIEKCALGADMCNAARAMMFAVGCIQALHCNTNRCPSGVATQDPVRGRAVNVPQKRKRVHRFHDATLESFREILGAMGKERVSDLRPSDIFRRTADEREWSYAQLYTFLEDGALLGAEIPAEFADDWARASSAQF